MRVRPEDYDVDYESRASLPYIDVECDFCDDRGCEECHPDDFAQMHLKWACDGTETLEESIEALQDFIKEIREYQASGFELSEPVDGSHFWLERTKTSDE